VTLRSTEIVKYELVKGCPFGTQLVSQGKHITSALDGCELMAKEPVARRRAVLATKNFLMMNLGLLLLELISA
jgi:hypothetical protein